jgi:hypothetical protein
MILLEWNVFLPLQPASEEVFELSNYSSWGIENAGFKLNGS